MSVAELFQSCLVVDRWAHYDRNDTLVLSPAIVGDQAGGLMNKRAGPCIFFRFGRCQIHAVKPYECRAVQGCLPCPDPDPHDVAWQAWDTPGGQAQIRDLLKGKR